MNIIKLDLQDGLGLVEVVVSSEVAVARLRMFMQEAQKALDKLYTIETGEEL